MAAARRLDAFAAPEGGTYGVDDDVDVGGSGIVYLWCGGPGRGGLGCGVASITFEPPVG